MFQPARFVLLDPLSANCQARNIDRSQAANNNGAGGGRIRPCRTPHSLRCAISIKHSAACTRSRTCRSAVAVGEVLGIVGHNGAGKSTLIKILSGAHPADSGEIYIAGERAMIETPREARAYGIETLYQNLALADNLDAAAKSTTPWPTAPRYNCGEIGHPLIQIECALRNIVRFRFVDSRKPSDHPNTHVSNLETRSVVQC